MPKIGKNTAKIGFELIIMKGGGKRLRLEADYSPSHSADDVLPPGSTSDSTLDTVVLGRERSSIVEHLLQELIEEVEVG